MASPSRWLSVLATHAAAAASGAALALAAAKFSSAPTPKSDDDQYQTTSGKEAQALVVAPPVASASPTIPLTVLRPHPDMEVAFDTRTRNAVYSLERLPGLAERQRTTDHDQDESKQRSTMLTKTREGMNFREEKSLAPSHRSRNGQYRHSGYDRGHLIPASDFRGDVDAVSATFNLCNVSPQNAHFNRRIMSRLEALIRSVAKEEWNLGRRTTYVVTGPLWLPSKVERNRVSSQTGQPLKDSFRFSHEAIGVPPCLVHVPTHFFKVVAVVKEDEERIEKLATFVLPNEEGKEVINLQNYNVRLSDLEAVAGMAFFPRYLGVKQYREESDDNNTLDLRYLADALTEDIWLESSITGAGNFGLTQIPAFGTSSGGQRRKKGKANKLIQASGSGDNAVFRHLCENKRCNVLIKP